MTVSATERVSYRSWQFLLAGLALGFGLGGFFDGILLHQILQWHHLLSGLEEARRDVRVLIMTDGLFHLLMYAVSAVGLWLMWRSRSSQRDRHLLGNLSIGFGLWHVVDGVLSHWILGIHRVRMDVESPLLWDMVWIVAFGLLPLALGWLLRGKERGERGRKITLPLLGLVVTGAGFWAALPGSPSSTLMVLFRPGTSEVDALAAVQAVNGRFVWADASRQLWAVDVPDGGGARLYLHGAMWVTGSVFPAACVTWIKV